MILSYSYDCQTMVQNLYGNLQNNNLPKYDLSLSLNAIFQLTAEIIINPVSRLKAL